MHSRLEPFATAAMLLLLLSPSVADAEPMLKAGVRLSTSGSRTIGWAAPEVSDWNSDGLNDVVIGHQSGDLFVYLNRGFGRKGIVFEKQSIVREDGFANGGRPIWTWRFNKANCVCPGPARISPRVVDWDHDGKKDLVIGDGRGAQTRIWRNIGSDKAPVFSTHHLQYLPPDAGVRPYHETVQPYIADWNGDGAVDLIMGRNRGVYFYLNTGTAKLPQFDFDRSRLGTKLQGVFPAERLSPVVVDWDDDGRQDLVVGSQRGEVWVARNTGSKAQPVFHGYTRLRAGGQVIHAGSEARIAVADLDGDGRKDLLVGGRTGVVWFYQANQPNPVARSQRVRVPRGGSAPVTLVGTDDSGRQLDFSVLTRPSHGILAGTPPNMTYKPEATYQGVDQFTFRVTTEKLKSTVAMVTIDVQPTPNPPAITVQPIDAVTSIGQPCSFHVAVSGTPPFTYSWKKDGELIRGASSPEYVIRQSKAGDIAEYTVAVMNGAGSVTSRSAMLKIQPLPGPTDDVPIVGLQYKSPVVEPSTPGILTLTRTGNTSQAVKVYLTSRRGHDPVIADLHFVPVPSSIELKAGQVTAEIRVEPIDNTLVTGTGSLTFLIVPNPKYRVEPKLRAAAMKFLDDDCPDVRIRVSRDAILKSSIGLTFHVTAHPAPARDLEIGYSVGGSAISGVDYETLPGRVTIPSGETTAAIVIKPYRRSTPDEKSVVLTLPSQPFTYFDFFRYLTHRPRTASLKLTSSSTNPLPPKPVETVSPPEDAGVVKLRREVSRLGWIVFGGLSDGVNSDLDLFVMRPDGSHLKNITNSPQFDEHSPRVSPDGKRILFRRTKKGAGKRARVSTGLPQDVGTVAMRSWPQNGTLVIAKSDGTEPRSLGSDGAFAWATWGPQGKRIACLEKVTRKESSPQKSSETVPKRESSYEIVIREVDTLRVVKTMPTGGIHSHAVWSPDGKRICGSANLPPGQGPAGKGLEYPLGVGKVASLDIESGQRTAMSLLPDWSPVWATDGNADWFQGGTPAVLHSANNYGICPAYYSMLWRSGLQGKPSQLIFGEFKKHVWSGCTSPDDRFAIFVIGGETFPLHGKMAIIRLADAPISRGRSTLFHEVLADHFPKLKRGPVLDLHQVREGFEPHWTRAELGIDTEQEKSTP